VRSNLPHIVMNQGNETVVGLAVFTPAIWFPSSKRISQKTEESDEKG